MKLKIFLFIFIMILSSTLSWAGFKTGPSYLEISLQPGESTEKEIYIENLEKEPLKLIVSAETFKNSKNNQNVSLNQWLKINTKDIIVKGMKKKLLKFKIMCPKNLEGEVSAKIGLLDKSDSGAMIHPKMTTFIYLIAQNKSTIGAELTQFDAINTKDNSVKFNVVIKNTGNIHIRPTGNLQIFDNKNKLLQKIKLFESMPVFEDAQIHLIPNSESQKLAEGQYLVQAEISLGYLDAYNIVNKYNMEIKKDEVIIKPIK